MRPYAACIAMNTLRDTTTGADGTRITNPQGWPIYIMVTLITDFNYYLNQMIFFVKKNHVI